MKQPFGATIVQKIDRIMVPFFRGYYEEAHREALVMTLETGMRGRTAGLEAQLFRAIESFARPGRRVDEAVQRALHLADQVHETADLRNEERLFFEFYGFMLAGWALTSRRGRQKLTEAIGYLDVALSRYRQAVETYSYRIPGAWLAYQFRGWAHYHRGEVERGIQHHNQGVLALNDYVSDMQGRGLVRRDGSAVRSFIRDRCLTVARLLATRAIMFYEIGDFAAALDDIDIALEIDPDNPYVHGLSGQIHFAMTGPRVATAMAVDHHAEAISSLLRAKELYAESGKPSSGRSEYLLNIFSYQCRNDPSTAKSLSREARGVLKRVPSNDVLTVDAFQKLVKTRRVLEAICCLLIGTEPLHQHAGSQEAVFAARMLFQVLSTIEGFYDYLGSLAIHETRSYSLLTRSAE